MACQEDPVRPFDASDVKAVMQSGRARERFDTPVSQKVMAYVYSVRFWLYDALSNPLYSEH